MSNHIHNLTEQLIEARGQITRTRNALVMLELYLLSPKFQGDDKDYVHVRTDMLPKLRNVRCEITLGVKDEPRG